MQWRRLAPVLALYGGLGAALTLGVCYAVALRTGTDLGLVALGVTLASLVVGPLLVGTTDTGLEAASAGAEAGFGGANPMALQPDSLPIPGRLALVCYCAGLFVGGVVTLVVVL